MPSNVDFSGMKSSAQVDKPIESRILVVRGQRVMLDTELAPSDFMFQLSREEAAVLRSQIVTLDEASTQPRGRGRYAKYLPYAFTEQGVAMLSSVLKSTRAVQANVEIMRAFVRLRGMVIHSAELARRLDALESKYDRQFKVVFDAIRELMAPPQPAPKRRIGFVSEASLTKYRSVQPD